MIKPIDGQLVSHFNEIDAHNLFLLAVKLNEVIQALNSLERENEKS